MPPDYEALLMTRAVHEMGGLRDSDRGKIIVNTDIRVEEHDNRRKSSYLVKDFGIRYDDLQF